MSRSMALAKVTLSSPGNAVYGTNNNIYAEVIFPNGTLPSLSWDASKLIISIPVKDKGQSSPWGLDKEYLQLIVTQKSPNIFIS